MSPRGMFYYLNILCDNERYRIQTEWNENNFYLILINNFTAYESNVTEDVLKMLADKYETNLDYYIEELRYSLRQENCNKYIFKKILNKLIISKREENITVQIADFELSQVDFNNCVLSFIDKIAQLNGDYCNEINELKKNLENTKKERDENGKKLEDFIKKKIEMEDELYSNFILILNEKKKHIQKLQEIMDRRGDVTRNEKIKHNKLEEISESESESSVDEPAEKVIHQVQIENHENSLKKKLIDDKNDNFIFNIPKRTKSDCTQNNIDIIMINNNNDEKIVEKLEVLPDSTTNKDSETQESLDFNTQDLFDRL